MSDPYASPNPPAESAMSYPYALSEPQPESAVSDPYAPPDLSTGVGDE